MNYCGALLTGTVVAARSVTQVSHRVCHSERPLCARSGLREEYVQLLMASCFNKPKPVEFPVARKNWNQSYDTPTAPHRPGSSGFIVIVRTFSCTHCDAAGWSRRSSTNIKTWFESGHTSMAMSCTKKSRRTKLSTEVYQRNDHGYGARKPLTD